MLVTAVSVGARRAERARRLAVAPLTDAAPAIASAHASAKSRPRPDPQRRARLGQDHGRPAARRQTPARRPSRVGPVLPFHPGRRDRAVEAGVPRAEHDRDAHRRRRPPPAYADAGYFTIIDGIIIPGWFFEPLRDSLDAGRPPASPMRCCARRWPSASRAGERARARPALRRRGDRAPLARVRRARSARGPGHRQRHPSRGGHGGRNCKAAADRPRDCLTGDLQFHASAARA